MKKTITVKTEIEFEEKFCFSECRFFHSESGYCFLFDKDLIEHQTIKGNLEFINFKRCQPCLKATGDL